MRSRVIRLFHFSVFYLFIAICLCSCEQGSNEGNEDLGEMPSMRQPEGSGILQYISEYRYAVNRIWTYDEYLYTEDGSLSKIITRDADSNLSSYKLHFYDLHGDCVRTEDFDKNDSPQVKAYYSYNEHSQIVSVRYDRGLDYICCAPTKRLYFYDENHFLVKVRDYNDSYHIPDSTIYRNDRFGNPIFSYYYSGDGSIKNVTRYVYKNNLLIKTGCCTTYRYDRDNNLVLIMIRPNTVHGAAFHSRDYIYEYYATDTIQQDTTRII